MRHQGYGGGPAVYKDAKIALVWKLWANAFPDARWIIVRRPIADVVRSVCAAEPMARWFEDEAQVRRWAEMYEAHVRGIQHGWGVEPTQDGLRGMIDWLGLEWNEEAVSRWVDWELLS
jgi:hypothetical protein